MSRASDVINYKSFSNQGHSQDTFDPLSKRCIVESLLLRTVYVYPSLFFIVNTVSEHQSHTPGREERHFLYFNHLSKEFLEQMIPHLKALI